MVDGWDLALLPMLTAAPPKVFDIRSLWPFIAIRGSESLKSKMVFLFRWPITAFIVKLTDHVTTVDPRLAQRIARMQPKSMSYLRNLPMKEMFENVPFGESDGIVDYGWFGSISPNRRVGELLKAWRKYIDRTDIDSRLWIFGWPAGCPNFFDTCIRPFFDDETICYMGKVPFEKVPNYYRKMDFIVAPNAGDHWQLKLGEALAAGVPIVVRYGKLHHQLIGENGVVYFRSNSRETDEDAILHALLKAVRNVSRFKEEAREKQPPYWEDEIERLIEVYHDIQE